MSEARLNLRKRTVIPTIFLLCLFAVSSIAIVQPVEATNSFTPATLSIGGSTLLAPLMTDWQSMFQTYTGGAVTVNYQAVGSTTGTNNMLSDIFSAGFSDAPIPANHLATLDSSGYVVSPPNSPPVTGLTGADRLLQIPDAIAPIAMFYNIPGLGKPLNLTGPILEEIYLQHITSWTNPHILVINPGLTPADITAMGHYPITVVHRSDGSGTSFALTAYFGLVDGNWTAAGYTAGSTSSSNFPVGELSAKGSGGVAALVASTSGAIGYGELSYAIGAGLHYAAVQNADGSAFILPSSAGATAAAAADASFVQKDPTYVIVNAHGAASYPLSTYTYVFVWQEQNLGASGGGSWTQGTTFDLVQFLDFIVTQGQSVAPLLTYAPLPPAVIQTDLGIIAQITYNGAQVLSPTTTTLACKPLALIVGKSVLCHSKTLGTTPTGLIAWSSTGSGAFSHSSCKIPKSGKCNGLFFTFGTSAQENITALYYGDINNAPSLASFTFSVSQTPTHVTFSCKPSSVIAGLTTTCRAVVTGFLPSGTVTFSQTSGTGLISGSASCTVAQLGSSKKASVCSVTITAVTSGKVTLTASYAGDLNNLPSSKPHSLTIK